MKIKISDFILLVTFYFLILLVFVIPRTLPISDSRGTVNIAYQILQYAFRGWLLLVSVYFIIESSLLNLIFKRKIYFFYLIAVSCFFFVSYRVWGTRNSIFTFFLLSIPIIYYLKNFDFNFVRYAGLVYNLVFISLLVQLIVFRYDGMPVFGFGDPNVSGFISLLFLFYSFLLNKKKGVTFSLITTFLFFSRTQIVAFVLFFLLLKFRKRLVKMSSIRFSVVYISSLLLFFLVTSFYLLNAFSFDKSHASSFDKVLSFNDASNFIRFTENLKVINSLASLEEKSTFFGFSSPEAYLEVGNKIFPHNDFLLMVISVGLFATILFLLVIFKVFDGVYKYNYFFLIPVLVFSHLLGGILVDFNFLLFIIFLVKNNSNRFILN